MNSKRFLARIGLRLILAAVVLGPTVPAAAQGDALPPPPADILQRMCADQEAEFAARMAFLQTKIGVKPEQRGEWDAFAEAAWAAEQPLRDLCANLPPPPKVDNPIAMLEARDRMTLARAAIVQATHAAVARLREKLTADQQRRLAEALLSRQGDFWLMHRDFGPTIGLRKLPPHGFVPHDKPLSR